MKLKNPETEPAKTKITAYTEEEILALIDFASSVSSPDFNNGSRPGWDK
jgi:hypothetical protein